MKNNSIDDKFVHMLKSPIIIVRQSESILCITDSKIEQKHDVCILGGLQIAILYNNSHVLLLECVVIN